MSAAVLGSPLQGVCGKRSLYDIDQAFHPSPVGKRVRFRGSPSGKAISSSVQAIFARLSQLFPEMENQTVADVLEKCGNNIDAAIKSLTELRLAACSPDVGQAGEGIDKGARGAAEAQGAPVEGEHAQQQQNAAGPQSAAEWVEAVVQEMGAAADMDDARIRAAKVLQGFEARVLESAGAGKDGAVKENAALRGHIEELVKDNTILKRAVNIQNARQQEIVGKEQELQLLRQQLNHYQEQLRHLEMSNYTLSVHLRQTQSPEPGPSPSKFPDYNRDVF